MWGGGGGGVTKIFGIFCSKVGLFSVSKSSMYLTVCLSSLYSSSRISFKFIFNVLKLIKKRKRLASNGAQSVPIGIPIVCLNTLLPTLMYILVEKSKLSK